MTRNGDTPPSWWLRLAGAAIFHKEEALGYTMAADDPHAAARLGECLACPHAGVYADGDGRRVLACRLCGCIVGAQEQGSGFAPAVKALCVRAKCPDPTGNRWPLLTIGGV